MSHLTWEGLQLHCGAEPACDLFALVDCLALPWVSSQKLHVVRVQVRLGSDGRVLLSLDPPCLTEALSHGTSSAPMRSGINIWIFFHNGLVAIMHWVIDTFNKMCPPTSA